MNANPEISPAHWLNSIAANIHVALFRYRILPTPGPEYLNQAISILTGYPLSAFQDNPGLLEHSIAPDDRARFQQILSESTDGAAVLRLIRRDGVIRPYEFHYIHILNREGQIMAVEGTIHSRQNEPAAVEVGEEVSVNERILYYTERLKTAGNISATLAEKLSLQDVYTLLSASVMELFPDTAMMTIARYHAETQQLTCVSAILDDETMDVSQFPPVALEPPGKGTQSEAVHTRKPVIIGDLTARQKQISKVVMVDKEGQDSGSIPQSALCVPMLSKGEVIGVVQLQSPILNRFSKEDAEMMAIVANTAAVAIDNATLVESINHARGVLQLSYDATLEGLSRALEMRDQETEGHTRRVAELTLNFGQRLKLEAQPLVDLWRGAFLHDIGKIGVPDAILRKAGPLTSEEWVVMRTHAELGARLLADVPFLKNSLEVPHYHHEKWDGSGYPSGLSGENIPLSARIFAIIDVWDALTSDRPYRKAWSREKALAYIAEASGSHFEPRLVTEFMRLIDA